MKYELRKDGIVYAQSDLPNLGYTPAYLRMILADGYRLYDDGKLMKNLAKK